MLFFKNDMTFKMIYHFYLKQERCERHTNLTEEINETALSSNDDKIMQWIDSIETYAYGSSKNLVSQKQDIKCSNIIKRSEND